LFWYWPLVYNFILSFMDWNFISPIKRVVGWTNYITLFNRPVFSAAFKNTFKYIGGILPLAIVVPLGMAVLLNSVREKSLKQVYETILFVPTVLSFSVACFVWIWMFSPIGGVIAQIFQAVGLPVISWLASEKYALWAIVIVSGWRMIGYHVLLFNTALNSVSHEYIEAAQIDGASPWRLFWSIKWPLISPTVFFLLITTVIFASDYVFIPIRILTKGGPFNSSTELVYLVYEYGFRFFNVGLASATAIIAFLVFLVIALLVYFFGERRVHYDS